MNGGKWSRSAAGNDQGVQTDGFALTRGRLVAGSLALQAAVLLIIGLEWLGISVSVVREIVVTGYLTFVPGFLVLALFGIDRRRLATMCGYAVGLSFAIVMLIGVLMSLGYPAIGIERPIAIEPLVATLGVTVVGLSALVYVTVDEFRVAVPVGDLLDFRPLFLLVLPFVSFLGAAVYVLRGNNYVLLGLLILIAVTPVAVMYFEYRFRWLGLLVWTFSLALIYHGQFGAGGGHQDAILTLNNGRWLVETGGPVLPNAILYPVYALMNGFSPGFQYGGVNPFLMSFIPLVLFESFRRYLSDDRSFLGACLFMFSFPFYTLYPGGGRIATPVLFLALLGLVVSDDELNARQKVSLSVMYGAGVAVSHYGTAYLVVFGVIISAVFLRFLFSYDSLTSGGERVSGVDARTDGGTRVLSVLRLPFVVFLSALVVAWYLLTDNARKFEPLPRKVSAQIDGILYNEFTGSAADAVSKSYGGSQSVAISRGLYLIVGGLILLGILLVLLLRLRRKPTPFTDEYLSLGVGFLGILGASFLPGGSGFNVARVMMISFIFTVPFAVVGIEQLLGLPGRAYRGLDRNRLRRVGGVLFSVLLCVFLLFNAGVAAELVLHDFAPSQAVSTQRLAESEDPQSRLRVTVCPACIIDTHVWVRSHATPDSDIYGDTWAFAQVDFYRSALTERLGYVPEKARYTSLATLSADSASGDYVMILNHNSDTGVFLNGSRYRIEPLSSVERELSRGNVVYHGGEGTKVYVLPDPGTRG